MDCPLIILLVFSNFFISTKCFFLDQPRLQSVEGHLYIIGAKDKNLTLVTSNKGYLNVNGINMVKAVEDAQRAAGAILNVKDNMISKLEDDMKVLGGSIENVFQRLNVCESFINTIPPSSGNTGGSRNLQRQVFRLRRQVREIIRNLTRNECQNDPCQNGGTCLDRYLDYECRCAEGWEGKSCDRDVNECARFAGTDLGCQNGATCVNKRGYYECNCPPGWYGLHCTRRQNDCNSGPASELCGHGICVSQASGTRGYSCICDQGWTTDGTNPACTVDIDECSIAPCSRNPPVTCHNLPGGFICGSCPPGYTGNGFLCTDINECLVQNGGCSVQPMVNCMNTIGSFTCGSCPPGYSGDGKTCSYVGKCQVDNGGCHQNARCQELGSSVRCQCLSGYTGPGFGINGCRLVPGAPTGSSNPCVPNPCRYGGRCTSFSSTNFTCSCPVGYSGRTCNIPRNPCLSSPCRNGGTCVVRRARFFTCRCTSNYQGRLCELERQSCGGVLQSDSGELQFPSSDSRTTRYSNNLSCAWVISVNHSLVINVTFEQFDLERGFDCQYDWVQIHDGRTAGDHLIGKYCGNTLPNNGTIITTSNNMYMWFKSDRSANRMGFKLKWNATAPVCGGEVNATIHGTIRSPGSPGRYPPNRDCYWYVVAPYGKKIRFTFFEIDLERHENCSYDYLFIHENLDVNSKVIGKYCNTSVPEPLDSWGNAALVHFHSDPHQSGKGFQIAYHPIPGHPGCGGVYTSRQGEIKPPTEDGKYIKNIDCAWIIRLPEDLKIQLTFRFLNLEPSTTCFADFVEIRDGADIYAPLLGKYCGNSLPAPITSNGNQLYVRFYADHSLQLSGFQIQYKALCGQTFTEDSGIIKNPGYPVSYRDEEDCIFIIQQAPGRAIELTFQDFDLEFSSSTRNCYYDYLEIRDGHDEKSPLLGRFCGNNKPTKIVSSVNYLWMRLVTDNSLAHRGFYANYTTIDVTCGGILKEPTGTIRSPTENSEYPPNQFCRWVISAKPGEIISLTFTSFKMEYDSVCMYDYVAVFDNSSVPQSGGLIGRFCGYTVPPEVTTTDNIMTIIFRTDSSYHLDGFTATYSIRNASTVCGGNYFTQTGLIKSPNYPGMYPNSKDCTWIIKVRYGRKVTLNIRDFVLESAYTYNKPQCYDYLEIRDGGYATSPLIGTYCGREIPSRITSQSNTLYVKFHSDSGISDGGFYILWDSTISGCGGTLSAFSGSIVSPNYPEPYGGNTDCNYQISVSSGSKVQLSFLDLELEDSEACYFDYIEILDGPDRTSKSLGKYCSPNNHPATILSTGNTVSIKFRSDYSHAGKGFYIKYRTICNTELTGFRGVIESPDFPNPFPPSMDCTWVITAPRGNKINASFSHFTLGDQCNDTYLEVKEGDVDGPPTNLIGRYCDKRPEKNLIASSLQKIYLHFVSDSMQTDPGSFRLEWVVNGCGGSFRKSSETFTSPNYPNSYPPKTSCNWLITVEPTSSIRLIIKNIGFEKSTECVMDSLEVYAGPDNSAPLLTKICHSMKDEVRLESSGNQMFVQFRSDQSGEGKGFTASYISIPAKCGGRFISNYGSIHSANYPQNYGKLDDCTWTIQVDPTHRVNLTFIDFDIANQDDSNCTSNYVEVYDGNTIYAPTLLHHCGNMLPTQNNILSSTNWITVRMRSNATNLIYTAKGFLANYSIACGAVITANEPGVIALNDHVNVKNENQNCSWKIISPEPDGHITLTINQLDISLRSDNKMDQGCDNSVLLIYDGVEKNSTLLGRYCGTKTPLPIVSQGNAIILKLESFHQRHQGFFQVTYSSASSACGGELLSEIGQFATPNYPNSYPPKSECVWTIATSPGNKVQVNFKVFDVAYSEHCNLDYVEIRENEATGKLLGVFCGNTRPSNLTGKNALWIKFKSGDSGSGNLGFLADYNLVYGNELSGQSGQIANPSYPRPFIQPFEPITWKITVPFGNVVQITFKKFHTDKYLQFPTCDYSTTLTIYDGYDHTAPVLIKACGLTVPDPVTSSSNIVFIKFDSEPMFFGSLFLLEWNAISLSTRSNSIFLYPTPSTPGCGGYIDLTSPDNRSVIITSPGYPTGYQNHLNCTWIVECPQEEHLLLTITALDIIQTSRCWHQYLTIYSGLNDMSNWEEKAKLCRNNETSTQYVGSNFMKINFYSGYMGNKTGFSLTVERDCGGSIRKSNGVIDFNWNYVPKQPTAMRNWHNRQGYCQWDVTVSPGRTIKATFTNFNLTSFHDGSCQNKWVLLRNGGTDDSPILGNGKYCVTPIDIPSTTSNRMFIKALSPFQSASFTLQFEEESHACGGSFHLDQDANQTIITSPNYPNIPPPKVECVWTFVTTGGHRLQIDFLDRFDIAVSTDNGMECYLEYVEVRDGGTRLSDEIGRYCHEKPNSQQSTGNMLYVKYFTNATDPKNGFKARVSLARCGGILRVENGVLTSPGYPNTYQYGLNCRWEIEADLNSKINVNFVDVDLPESFTRLRVRSSLRLSPPLRTRPSVYRRLNNCTSSASIIVAEPPLPEADYLQSAYPSMSPAVLNLLRPFLLSRDRSDTIITTVCSNDKPQSTITSSGSRVVIIFNSGPSANNPLSPFSRGFKLNFSSASGGCDQTINTASGVITSPNYPNERPSYYFCNYKITVPTGRRVTLTVNDIDLVGSNMEQRLSLFHDHQYKSRFDTIISSNARIGAVYKSSSNQMLINYWSNTYSGGSHKGFRLSFNSDEPALCGGNINENEGTISSPKNQSTYVCEWQFPQRWEENQTIAFTISNSKIGNRSGDCRLKYASVVAISSLGDNADFDARICGNVSSLTVRSPMTNVKVTAVQNTWYGPVDFTLNYKRSPCGGVIYATEATITSPSYPNSYSQDLDCAWLIKFPVGMEIKITFQDLQLEPSCADFLTIKNGGSFDSPLIDQFCGTVMPSKFLVSESSSVLVEFHSDSKNQGKGFKISFEPANAVCGGIIHSPNTEIMTPNFPSAYGNNQECEWEIRTMEGTHIGLIFMDRFNIEMSENCKNDYVSIYDYKKGKWEEIKKLCGREFPNPLNSTSTRMKIIFRSNNDITSDGFKARWEPNCGGTFTNVEEGTIVSPGYPGKYPNNIHCVYNIEYGADYINFNFTYFQLEDGYRGLCKYDGVEFFERALFNPNTFESVAKFCGPTTPTPRKFKSPVRIEFKTDSYTGGNGFSLDFSHDGCGGYINESKDIEYKNIYTSEQFFYGSDPCVWEIVAPSDMIVVVRVTQAHFELYHDCRRGLSVLNGTAADGKLIGRVCGDLNPNLPVFRSTGNKLTLKLPKYPYFNTSFTASVLFSYGPEQGCGGTIDLGPNPETVTSPDINRDGLYEEFMDCSWTILSRPFHYIIANVIRLDMDSCNVTDTCLCDYVELRDGLDTESDLLTRMCGKTPPPTVTSSGDVMLLRMATDGTVNGKGFSIQFSSQLSQCGRGLVAANDSIQFLRSPNYPQNYPEGIRCKWVITTEGSLTSFYTRRSIHIRLDAWDIEDTDTCNEDYLTIEDSAHYGTVYEAGSWDVTRNKSTSGMQIIRGKYTASSSLNYERLKICGSGQYLDFYSETNEVTITFVSNSGITKKGFQLEYSHATCNRNYTSPYGRIKQSVFKNNTHCYMTIAAPSSNHTISLYFSVFYMQTFGSEGCEKGFLEVRDGPDVQSPLIKKVCGFNLPDPVFSTGQYLWLHAYTEKGTPNSMNNIDITYMTTDQGKGCGGRIFASTGVITSPEFPNNYRQNSACRWDVVVPMNLVPQFTFNTLDIGPPNTCETDYIAIYDYDDTTNLETFVAKFCGGNQPAVITANRDNTIIRYTTSVHNGGTGWKLTFKAVAKPT